eukprot:gene4121-2966_t
MVRMTTLKKVGCEEGLPQLQFAEWRSDDYSNKRGRKKTTASIKSVQYNISYFFVSFLMNLAQRGHSRIFLL